MYKILLSIAALLLSSASFAADPVEVWADFQLTASVRATAKDDWKPIYAAPFGARQGYSVGVTLQDKDASASTDASAPTCFTISFSPQAITPSSLLVESVEVTLYHGADSFCRIGDPSDVLTLAKIELKVGQGEESTFQFPFLAGKQIQYTLSQKWKPAPLH